jgi:hypothetical protein
LTLTFWTGCALIVFICCIIYKALFRFYFQKILKSINSSIKKVMRKQTKLHCHMLRLFLNGLFRFVSIPLHCFWLKKNLNEHNLIYCDKILEIFAKKCLLVRNCVVFGHSFNLIILPVYMHDYTTPSHLWNETFF